MSEAPAWHQALVYALTGERRPELGRQDDPDLRAVEAALEGRGRTTVPVPADLMSGIGAARFAAVLAELRRRLAASRAGSSSTSTPLRRPVLAERSLDADERRLQADVPPHH